MKYTSAMLEHYIVDKEYHEEALRVINSEIDIESIYESRAWDCALLASSLGYMKSKSLDYEVDAYRSGPGVSVTAVVKHGGLMYRLLASIVGRSLSVVLSKSSNKGDSEIMHHTERKLTGFEGDYDYVVFTAVKQVVNHLLLLAGKE